MFIILVCELDSSEEINPKYLEKFILTNLKIKNFKFTKKSKIFYSYITPLFLYQIIVFENEAPDFFFYKSNFENEIFLNDNFALVYKNKKLFYYQKFQEDLSSAEILSFLQKRLNLKDVKTIKKDSITLDKKIAYSFIKPVKSHSFRYFVIYFLCLLIGFSFFELNEKKEKTDLKTLTLDTKHLKKEINFYSVSEKIKKIYKFSKKYNCEILNISLKDSKINLKLESKNKKEIYEFFKKLGENTIENIVYDKEKLRFLGDASFKINRK